MSHLEDIFDKFDVENRNGTGETSYNNGIVRDMEDEYRKIIELEIIDISDSHTSDIQDNRINNILPIIING